MDEYALDFLQPAAQTLVRDMISTVVHHPDIHVNELIIRRSRVDPSGFEYFLGMRAGNDATPFQQGQFLPTNIIPQLLHHGLLELVQSGPNERRHSFTEAALEWHSSYGGPSVDTIQKTIGRDLYKQLQQGAPRDFDENAISEKLGVDPARVRAQVNVLLATGLIEPRFQGQTHFGTLRLTREGARWAASDFPPIRNLAGHSTSVSLDLHVEVRTIIDNARASPIDPTLLERFEARLRRVEEELAKPEGQGDYEKVKDLVETANNSRQLLGDVIPFLIRHWDKIQEFGDAAGNMLT